MDSDSEEEQMCTPPDIVQAAQIRTLNLLPEKSRTKYEKTYTAFMDWRIRKNVTSFSENVLIAYFGELADKFKSSTLWASYSMIKTTLSINNNINIETYSKLKAMLKRKSEGYQARKAKTFTTDEIHNFITKAPDDVYLQAKVALIMGIMGACRCQELHAMKLTDIEDLGSAFLVKIPNTKNKVVRKFTITEEFYTICKNYINLRPNGIQLDSLFLNYQKGALRAQKCGINKFSAMGKNIATFLKLPNPELYTGHSFRRSSATLLVDAGGDITSLKRHGGWWSTSVAEGYIDDSMKNKMDTAERIFRSVTQHSAQSSASINSAQATSSTTEINFASSSSNTTPSINISDCSNFTININYK